MGKHGLYNMFHNETFEGLSFAEQWVKEPDMIKNRLKKERAFHKILILGIGYAMGPAHMVEAAMAGGYELSMRDAKEFFKAYWSLFKGVKLLGAALEDQFKQTGYLVNLFGYRLIPDVEYKCLNYFIQSSVSGLINSLCYKFFTICPDAKFTTIIHDEIIFSIPESQKEEAKSLFNQALESLNNDLGWEIKVRTGWKEGRDLYEAK